MPHRNLFTDEMGCFSVQLDRKARNRQNLPPETKLGSYFPSPASSCSVSRRDFEVEPPVSRPSPGHPVSFKLTSPRSLADASPMRKYPNSHRGHEHPTKDGAVERCFSCGYCDERSAVVHSLPIASFVSEIEQGSAGTHLFPLPLPPSSFMSSSTSLNTCSDDASSHSVSSTGSESYPCAAVPSPSCSTPSLCANIKSCTNLLSLSSTADSYPAQRWCPSPLPLPPLCVNRPALREFSYEELAGACLNFAREFFIREGGTGPVYRAVLKRVPEEDSADVAVTRLIRGHLHSFKKWRFEVGSLARMSHPHLCNVFGFSGEDPSGPSSKLPGFERERLLVYEHTANGSLESLLYCRKGKGPLDWGTRLKIAMGAAKGLAYLHDRIPRQVIYKSFKTVNVQVDVNFNAKLSDYGFARTCGEPPISSPAPSLPMSDAYAAPETCISDQLSAKSNVWSFGIVLLELLTGRQNMDDFFPPDERNLLHWCRPYLLDSKRLYLIMDPELKGRYPTRTAKMVADLALQCLAEDPVARPSMRDVAASLCAIAGNNVIDGKVGSASATIQATNRGNHTNASNVARGSLDTSTNSNNYGSKFKLSKSHSLASVLASPARAFVGARDGNDSSEAHGHSQRARLRGFLSGEISKEACRSWARDHPALLGSYGFLSGEIGVQDKRSVLLRSPVSQDSYLPPPLGRSIASSSRQTPVSS